MFSLSTARKFCAPTSEGWCGQPRATETCPTNAFNVDIRKRNWLLTPPIDVTGKRAAVVVVAYHAECRSYTTAEHCDDTQYFDISILNDTSVDFEGITSDPTLDGNLLGKVQLLEPMLPNDAVASVPASREVDFSGRTILRVGLIDSQGCFYVERLTLRYLNCPATRTRNIQLPKTYSDPSSTLVVNGTCAQGYTVDPAKVGGDEEWRCRRVAGRCGAGPTACRSFFPPRNLLPF